MPEVILDGWKRVRRMSQRQLDVVMQELTLKNPEYISATKFSNRPVYGIPEYLEFFDIEDNHLVVPRGYPLPFEYEIVEDNRLINQGITYPPLYIKLRDVQQEAVDAYSRSLERRDDSGIIVLPTGTGKSITGLYIARQMRQRALIIVQKEDLIDGWTKDAKVVFGMRPWEVGIIRGKKFHLGKHITITTIQTLSQLPEEQLDIMRGYFGMLIQDEMHRSVADSYQVINSFPARFKIGLTATLMRNDGREPIFRFMFGKVGFFYEDVGGDDNILPVTVKLRKAPTEWSPRGKKFVIAHLRQAVMECRNYNLMLATDIAREYDKGKSCIVFTHLKEHCEVIEGNLVNLGVPRDKIQLYYGDSKTPKDVMKERAEKREVLVTIATYAIATEGTNVKAWERGFLASTVANEKDTIQAIGRCRRTAPGKEDCIIYDYSFPNIHMISKHAITRKKVYEKYQFTITGNEKKSPRPPSPRQHYLTGKGKGKSKGWGRRFRNYN